MFRCVLMMVIFLRSCPNRLIHRLVQYQHTYKSTLHHPCKHAFTCKSAQLQARSAIQIVHLCLRARGIFKIWYVGGGCLDYVKHDAYSSIKSMGESQQGKAMILAGVLLCKQQTARQCCGCATELCMTPFTNNSTTC